MGAFTPNHIFLSFYLLKIITFFFFFQYRGIKNERLLLAIDACVLLITKGAIHSYPLPEKSVQLGK